MKRTWIFTQIYLFSFLVVLGAQDWTSLEYNFDQPGLEYNPLKGFATMWNPENSFPHSLQGKLFGLNEIMKGSDDFDWTVMDSFIKAEADKGNTCYLQVNIDPARPGVTYLPDFLKSRVKLMETTENLYPDWNDEDLMAAMINFIEAYGQKYNKDPRVFLVHFGLYGMWGEWHLGGQGDKKYQMTFENMTRLSDAYLRAFPDKQLLARYPENLPDSQVVGYSDGMFFGHSISSSMSWYFLPKLENAHAGQNWKLHAIGGEIVPELQNNLWKSWPNTKGQDVEECLRKIHPTWLFSHYVLIMKPEQGSPEWQNAIKAQKMLGYNLFVNKYRVSAAGGKPVLELGIQNRGVAPLYENWDVELAVIGKENEFQVIGKTRLYLNHILPSEEDHYRIMSASKAIPDGEYIVLLRIVNPMEKFSKQAKPLRFANTTQDKDREGWLTLGKLSIAGGKSGTPPVRVTGMSLATNTQAVAVGTKFKIDSKVYPENAAQKNIFWVSSHPATASVDQAGVVTAGPITGEVKITAFTEDGCFTADRIIKVEPAWLAVSDKIEAENYMKQAGTQLENTADTGGGKNLGYLDNGDWMIYPIINTGKNIYFEAQTRVAAQSREGLLSIYLDDKLAGWIKIPNTGNWQKWETIKTKILIPKGKHILKLFVEDGGFNLNYFTFQTAEPFSDKVPPLPKD